MEQEYYLGLDMGTGSVGWAVTDSEYHVLRKHGKALWGVRLFESASTAEERRMFRTSRRRLDRRNWRIEILQEIFAEEISKKDPGFFLRMKESKYYPEDKRDINGNCPELPYALFVDDDFTDKDYHKNQDIFEKYTLYQDLYDYTSGKNPLRMSFERYVLSAYFEQILEFANIELLKMTQGRFALYLAGEPYKSGLKAQGCGKLKKAVFTMELDPDEEDETEAE